MNLACLSNTYEWKKCNWHEQKGKNIWLYCTSSIYNLVHSNNIGPHARSDITTRFVLFLFVLFVYIYIYILDCLKGKKKEWSHIASNILTPFHVVRSTCLHSLWSLTRRFHLLHTLQNAKNSLILWHESKQRQSWHWLLFHKTDNWLNNVSKVALPLPSRSDELPHAQIRQHID